MKTHTTNTQRSKWLALFVAVLGLLVLSTSRGKRRRRRAMLPTSGIEMLEDRKLLSATGFEEAAGSPIPVGDSPNSVAVGDFNADGALDLATANYFSNDVSVLLGDGSGGFTPFGLPVPVGDRPSSVAVGDFNGDAALDLVIANSGSDDNVSVLLGDGSGGFTPFGSPVPVGDGPAEVAVGDFNGDGVLDLATANVFSADVSVLLGDGSGGFTPFGPAVPVGSNPFSVAVGDFNGDDHLDLVTTDLSSNNVNVLLGDGSGGFTPFGAAVPVGSGPRVVVGDFNSDEALDLATANYFSNDVSVLLGDGSGGFTPFGLPVPVGDRPSSVAVGDFNGDGALDLATANFFTDDVSVLLGDGSGGFTPFGSPVSAGDSPVEVAVGDFNGDGALDLATANFDSGNLSVLLNTRIDISIGDVTIVEGDSGVSNAIIEVRLNRAHDESITLDYAAENGTATAGEDFVNTFGSLTFLPGQTSRWIVAPVIGDMKIEGDETFSVRLGNSTFGRIADELGNVTILNDNDAQATLESVVINDGSVQRSKITSITVTFSDQVTLKSGAFSLTNQHGVSFAYSARTSLVGGKTVATLTFIGSGIIGGSLPDGIYTLAIRSDRILDTFGKALDGDGDGVNGGDASETFFRRFGDSDGDGDVDDIDQALFKSAFRTKLGVNGYLEFFDYDSDGDIDRADQSEFNKRYTSGGSGKGRSN